MSRFKNGDMLIGTHGPKKHKCAWVYASGMAHSMNPLGKSVLVKETDKLPLKRMGQEIHKVTNDINELKEHCVPYYTSL